MAGRPWTITHTLASILAVLLTMSLAWAMKTTLDMRDFMSAGGRCTQEQCASTITRVSLLEQSLHHTRSDYRSINRELERQQLQIDRLEGHDVKNYTEDQAWILSEEQSLP